MEGRSSGLEAITRVRQTLTGRSVNECILELITVMMRYSSLDQSTGLRLLISVLTYA